MSDEILRPDPDALLAAIQKEDEKEQRGKLKIFFGMAAGVGKTYAMLDAAHARKADGVDVIVGYVETHKRAETEALVKGLEVIPRQKLEYRGTWLDEMDLDAILARKPQLVLVDELAHTNAPGTRHPKRYQDVIELLEAGIDVYTTVNVQHFESRADTVRQITGITVHETVPDTVLDLADEVELIDLSPEDLRKRLAEGKVYTPEKTEIAADNFFRVGNLTALREMALRLTAERVDHQLQDYMQIKQIAGPWKSSERLMVAVGASGFSEKLIRWTRRTAYNLEAPWIAAYVETSKPLSPDDRERLGRNLALAADLGGEVITTAGDDIPDALLRLARQRNITQIVMGKPLHSRLRDLLRGGSPVDKIIRTSGDIDIMVVTGDSEKSDDEAISAWIDEATESHSTLSQYVLALLVVAVVTIVDLMIAPYVTYEVVGLTELLAVLLIAVYIGRGPALVAAAASAISWNFLFIEPRYTFSISRAQDIFLLVLYFAIALFTGNLTSRIRSQARQARQNADRSMALYTFAREVAAAVNMDDVLRAAVTEVGRVFNAQVAILLAERGELGAMCHPYSTLQMDDKEMSVARWSFDNGKPAGRFTDTLPLAAAQYVPLQSSYGIVGVMGIRALQQERLSFDQAALLETFTNQLALVIEREMLDQAAEQAAMAQESERLYTTLLNSISHELRTPIATITGAASSLRALPASPNSGVRVELTNDIQDAADRLNRLVENLLDMSRLESGRLRLKNDWCDVGDVISVAVKRLEKCIVTHPIQIDVAPNLPLVQMDFVLIEQVLVNVLDNACNYTPPESEIQITARASGSQLEVAITDSGGGIPPAELARIFDKFYRLPGTATGGTGLGLSIARGLVEAHGGTLTGENAPPKGARFIMRLPLGSPPPTVQEAAL
jgi:two-component system, OmpR family, sensor histidine kinase KdpD